jgi:predicted nuclease of restriction endonuclease-like (RecB) superfamily
LLIQFRSDKEGVKQLSKKGQIVESALDVIKDPYVLELLGLKEEYQYSKSQLETRIIDQLQYFMLEHPNT